MNPPNLPQRTHPAWVCHDCGTRYGRRVPGEASTWHIDTCDVCGQEKPVTQPRDYGGLMID
jgi:hypothetical protein